MIKIQNKQIIALSDWDELVEKTYGKPYSFQQQNDCMERQTYDITIPSAADDFENDTIPDEVNGEEMGVSFAAWLARDVKQWNGALEDKRDWSIELFWQRNFYPDIQMIANNLHAKGLIPAGKYGIEIDW